MRQVFLDTETTGLSPETGDRIVEIGCVELLNRRLTGNNKHFYLNPERKNSEEAVRIHGLTDEFLSTKPLFKEIADELMDYLAGAELIIHNAAFDVGFLDAELKRVGKVRVAEQVSSVTDSLQMAREMFPGKANSLDALCRRLEVDNSSRTLHGALLDSELLAEVYIRMTRGQDALVMEREAEGNTQTLNVSQVDLRGIALPVIDPTLEELKAHEAVLKEFDKEDEMLARWKEAMA
jgi:DNA polymerase III subunit epsilon